MAVKQNFLDRFSERLEDLDANSRQAYILRLARERGFFETVFNAVEEGILVVDRRLKIRYFNRAARELLALPEDITSLRVSQLLQGVDWRRILREDEEEWTRVARQEVEILYPVRRFVQFYLVPYPEDAGLAAVIIRDVTESRNRTMNELENETVQAVSMLAAGVAHEIGNPLNSLYLNLQLLERSVDGSGSIPPGDAADMVRICKEEVERLDSIIHRFLSAIRPGEPNFAPVDVRQLIIDVLTFMRPEIEAAGAGRRGAAQAGVLQHHPQRGAGDEQRRGAEHLRLFRRRLPDGGVFRLRPGGYAAGAEYDVHRIQDQQVRRQRDRHDDHRTGLPRTRRGVRDRVGAGQGGGVPDPVPARQPAASDVGGRVRGFPGRQRQF